MNTLFKVKVSLAGVVFAAIAGCANFGNSGAELSGSSISKTELPNISEKIELQIPFDKWELTAEHKAELTEFLKNLRTATKNRTAVTFGAVVVTGHTDRIGALPYNMQISERLAAGVKDYLVNAEHVDPALIIWEGKGPVEPIPVTEFCNNKMTSKQIIECLAPNRRVTIEVIGTAKPQANFAVLPAAPLATTR